MATEKKACKKHLFLHFEDGGFHIVCRCGYSWVATSDGKTTPDYNAMFNGLQPTDHRNDPFSLEPKPTSPKPTK